MKIIGLSGKAESGKDYLADRYISPKGYFRFSLAWHFKVWLVGKGLATHEEVFVTKPAHVRKLLQEEGTERGRMVFGEMVWCHTMGEWFRVMNEYCGVDHFVVPDVRFPNEVEYIQSLGGKVFSIIAPERVRHSQLTDEARAHISETALDGYKKFDGYIYNDSGFAPTVKSQIDNLLR